MKAATTDPALRTAPVLTAPGLEYGSNMRRFQGIPGIERTEGGRLWAVWYAGGPDEPGEGPGNYVVLVTSTDDGSSWSLPKLVIDPPDDVRAFDPMLWIDPSGRLWLFWAQSQGTYDGRAGVWCIVSENPEEEAPSWSAPRRITDGIVMNKPTVLKNGEWLLPVGVWVRKAGGNTPEQYQYYLTDQVGSAVWVSTDEGATWSFRGKADVANRSFDEHMVVERQDGSLWMLVRAQDGIGTAVSYDTGRTWSVEEPRIPHVSSRFFIRRLRSGKLLLVKHADGCTVRSHLTAYLSEDDGRTWYGELLLDERAGVSYPDGVEAEDGRIYIIYDYDRKGDREILLAVFTEDDVTHGKILSAKSRLGVLVNKASYDEASTAS